MLARREAFQAALLGWFAEAQRPLPWREAPSLYRTVVSEFMLQQTQVKTMLPYFDRWMEALPDFGSLAAAGEAQVLRLWEGLGYYSRARNLHRLAKTLVALPEIPRTAEAWQKLPGVGPYTASAITSIDFGANAAVVDGNVVRILTRLTADERGFLNSSTAAKALAPLAQELLNASRPGDYNQAMMELGATICKRHRPLCTICPVFAFCAAARAGDPDAYPRLAPKQIEQVSVMRAWCRRDGHLLLHRADADAKRLAGQYELPSAGQLGIAEDRLMRGRFLARHKRSITRYAITEWIYEIPADALPHPPLLSGGADAAPLRWVLLETLPLITLSGPHRRWITALLEEGAP